MFGEGGDVRGVIPRSVEYLFQSLAKKTLSSEVAMVCSFLEIYNDQIRDLGKAYLAAMGVESNTSAAMYEKTSDLFEKLAGKRGNPYFAPAFHKAGSAMQLSGAIRPGLKEVQDEYNTMNYEIREDNEGNVFVKDLSLVPVTTMEEVMSLIATGLRVRATHETKMNAFSSRSHTVFTITVLQRDKMTGEAITGMLNLVDLAGSERLKKSESIGVRLKEALHINTSLTALGKVIMALDPSSENSHIPYRDSKLTRVLQNSLGGNSYTSVIATVHPTSRYYEECLSSLQFANRCRNVRNNPRVNYVEDTEDKDRKIRKLMEEIGTLRSKMTHMNGAELQGGVRSSLGGAGGSAAAKLSPADLVNLLKRLGIAATLHPDGNLLVNGQKFGTEDIGLGGDGADAVVEGRVTTSSKDNSGVTEKNVEKLQKTVKELKESNASYAAKAKERKLQMEEQGRQLQKLSVDLVKLQTGMRHKEFECKTLAEEKERSLSEMKTFLEGKYAGDLQLMINHNREVMHHHQADIDKIPTALTEYTKLFAKAEKERTDLEAPLKADFDAQLKEIENSRQAELAHIKSQFDFWLEEKDKALSGFVDNFNAYRAKKSEQLRMAEREIVHLYEYYAELDRVLEDARRGKFYVRPKEILYAAPPHAETHAKPVSGEMEGVHEGAVKGSLVIPKADLPQNPFKSFGPSTLGLTRKIVEKHKEREMRLKHMKTDAIRKSIHYAAESAKHMGADAQLEGNVRNFLVTFEKDAGAVVDPHGGGIVFTTQGAQRPITADARLVKKLPNGAPKQPEQLPARPTSSTGKNKPRGAGGGSGSGGDAGQKLSSSHQQNSVHSNPSLRDPTSRVGLNTAPGGMQNNSRSDPEIWGDESRSGSPNGGNNSNNRRTKSAVDQINQDLLAEVEMLRAKEKAAKVQELKNKAGNANFELFFFVFIFQHKLILSSGIFYSNYQRNLHPPKHFNTFKSWNKKASA